MTVRRSKVFRPSIQERVVEKALKLVLDWYCHSDAPCPEWWKRVGPYKDILEVLP
jgi:hypothetical protein